MIPIDRGVGPGLIIYTRHTDKSTVRIYGLALEAYPGRGSSNRRLLVLLGLARGRGYRPGGMVWLCRRELLA